MTYDVIVVGLGAMGSSAALPTGATRSTGAGIEALTPAHELGSSGGLTRIIRLAYFEHPSYVPLLRATWEMWPKIEAEAGESADESRARFPALLVDDDMQTLHEPLAGILFPEECIAAHIRLATAGGAELHVEERVLRWDFDGDGVHVLTDHGSHSARRPLSHPRVPEATLWCSEATPVRRWPQTVRRSGVDRTHRIN